MGKSTDIDIGKKLDKAFRKFMAFKAILGQKTTIAHRLRLLRSTVLAAALWGSESWTPTKHRLSRLRGWHLSLLRCMVTRPPIDDDSEIHPRIWHDRQCLKVAKIHHHDLLDVLLLQKYYRWAGHIGRLQPDRHLLLAIRDQNVASWRNLQSRPGTPRHLEKRGNLSRWENPLCRLLGDDWLSRTQNREVWKKRGDGFCAGI